MFGVKPYASHFQEFGGEAWLHPMADNRAAMVNLIMLFLLAILPISMVSGLVPGARPH